MKRRRLILTLGLAALPAAAAAQVPTDRVWQEGRVAVRELSGTLNASAETPQPLSLNIQTQWGDVHLHADTVLRYTLTWRASDAVAAQRLENWPVEIYRSGDTVSLSAQVPAAPPGASLPPTSLDINIGVPPGLRAVAATTALGSLFADGVAVPLSLSSSAGSIHADRLGGPLDASSRSGDIAVGVSSAAVHLETAGRIEVARAATVAVTDHGGSVVVRQSDGLVRIVSDGGPVLVGSAAGLVTVASRGGNIELDSAPFGASLHTGGGNITVGNASNLDCSTANGDILLRRVGGRVEGSTGAGQITAALAAGVRLLPSQLLSQLGGIALTLPPGLAADLETVIRNPAGHQVRSELPNLVFSPLLTGGQIEAAMRLRGGGPRLQLISTASDITLTRD